MRRYSSFDVNLADSPGHADLIHCDLTTGFLFWKKTRPVTFYGSRDVWSRSDTGQSASPFLCEKLQYVWSLARHRQRESAREPK